VNVGVRLPWRMITGQRICLRESRRWEKNRFYGKVWIWTAAIRILGQAGLRNPTDLDLEPRLQIQVLIDVVLFFARIAICSRAGSHPEPTLP